MHDFRFYFLENPSNSVSQTLYNNNTEMVTDSSPQDRIQCLSDAGSYHAVSTNNQRFPVLLKVIPSSYLLNRGQWYTLRCQLLDEQGNPVFVGRYVVVDRKVSFQDSRKRLLEDNKSSQEPLILNIVGYCSTTGKELKKCKKCKEQDKISVNRKRKSEADEDTWTPLDEENNDKLIQVLETGGHCINIEGTIEVRFRISCCVGATRQFHNNHLSVNTEGAKPKAEIHRDCLGINLTTSISNTDIEGKAEQPIRVVGKISKKTGNSKSTDGHTVWHLEGTSGVITHNDKISQSSKLQLSHILQPVKGTKRVIESTDTASSKKQNTSPTKSIVQFTMNTIPHSPRALSFREKEPLWHIREMINMSGKRIENSAALHRYMCCYLNLIPADIRNAFLPMFESSFYSQDTLANIEPLSIEMLHLYNTICILDLILKGGKRKEYMFAKTEQMALDLLRTTDLTHINEDKLLLLADGVCRVSLWKVFQSKFDMAKYFAEESATLWDLLLSQKASYRYTIFYEFHLLTLGITYPQFNFLQEVHNQDNLRSMRIRTRLLTNLILIMFFPQFKFSNLPVLQPLSGNLKIKILSLIDILDDCIVKTGLKATRNAAKLADTALSSLRNLTLWNIENAFLDVEECALIASVASDPSKDSVVQNIASFTAVQLLRLASSQEKDKKRISIIYHSTDVLLQFSSKCYFPFGRFIDEVVRNIFNQFQPQ
jgi:hypothetical protein